MSSPSDLQKAAADLEAIKRAITRLDAEDKDKDSHPSAELNTQISLHYCVCGLLTLLILSYLLVKDAAWKVTEAVYYSPSPMWRYLVVIFLALVLLVLAVALAISLRQSLKREGESFDEHLFRSFKYLRRVAFASDVFVKFIALVVVVLAGRADWISPLLIIFTGDYLLQGRFFAFPLKWSLVLGLACMVFGVVYLIFLYGNLLYAFVLFLLLTLFSLRVLQKERQEMHSTQSE